MEENTKISKYSTKIIRFVDIDYEEDICNIEDNKKLHESQINNKYLKIKESAKNKLSCLTDIRFMINNNIVNKNSFGDLEEK